MLGREGLFFFELITHLKVWRESVAVILTFLATGQQTTMFKTEARSIVARCVNASKDDVVIFAGSGSSGALKVTVDESFPSIC